jgi:hypothetical protein
MNNNPYCGALYFFSRQWLAQLLLDGFDFKNHPHRLRWCADLVLAKIDGETTIIKDRSGYCLSDLVLYSDESI